MARNKRNLEKPFDEPGGTEINPDTLEPRQRPRTELEPDFAAAPNSDAIDVTEVTEDVYFPPVDPPVAAGMANGREGIIGGFEPDSMAVHVDPSASSATPGDEALADAIRAELSQDAATAGLGVQVEVVDGVARLTGRVADLDDVENAEEVSGRVPGVREVVEELELAG